MTTPALSITAVRHPTYLYNLPDWDKWRRIWEGGDIFTQRYLKKFSERERQADFDIRKDITPVPGFAKAALTDIKNAVFHRMGDITRRGGSRAYTQAVSGFSGGVDRHGAAMNHFIGTQVLPELLSMGKVGIYVDNLPTQGPTLADARDASPYIYMYPVEDILSWRCSKPEESSDFQAILLRDWCLDFESIHLGVNLPSGQKERYRMVWIGEDGYVWYQLFNAKGQTINSQWEAQTEPVRLDIRRIPFVMMDIGDSLLRDISNHQIALLNLVSSDVAYALKSNYPFYIEQQDTRAIGSHLKSDVMEDGTASSGGQASRDKDVQVGAMDGRIYDIKTDAPGFIHPSSEPLKASMALQKKLEDDIRKLVNLAVVSLGTSRASGEARAFDNQGLEAGLAFIGNVLENGERKIANHWTAYEGDDSQSKVVVKYPDTYSMKSTKDRLEEADKLTDLMFAIPGQAVKKELSKDAVVALLGGRVTPDKLEEIFREIDTAPYATSDPEIIRLAKEEGLASDITCSDALGFDGETEVPAANDDHAKRIARIQESQAAKGAETGQLMDAGARGVKDLDDSPSQGAVGERSKASDTTVSDTTKKPVRGKGKKVT